MTRVIIIKKKQFIKNGIVLSLTTLVIRSIGMWFRIYMSERVGTEGIGLYQLILTVYALFATVTTSGVSLTVTRLVTDLLAQNEIAKAKYLTYRCLIASVLISLVFGIVLFSSAELLGVNFINDERTVPALKILAPSLPFMAFSACLRGYFYARRKIFASAGEQLLEQIIEIAVFVIIFSFFSPNDITSACCALVLGTTVAEIISFFYSLALYASDSLKFKCRPEKVPHLIKKASLIAIPVTASSLLRSGLSSVENILIPSGLKKYGSDCSRALSQYGLISGMAMPVLIFPSVFIMPFATLIIPELSQSNIEGRVNGIRHMSEKMFRLTLIYSLPIMIIFMFFAKEIGYAVYGDNEVGIYIAFLAPVVPLMYLDSAVDGMLKGLNEQASYLAYNIIDSVIRVLLTYILLPRIGIAGVVIVIITSELLNTTLSIARLLKITGIRLMIWQWVIRPIICILIPCLISAVLPSFGNYIFDLIFKISLCMIFYIFALYISKAPEDTL